MAVASRGMGWRSLPCCSSCWSIPPVTCGAGPSNANGRCCAGSCRRCQPHNPASLVHFFCLGLEVLRELSEGGCWQIGGVVGRGGGAGGGGGRGDASLAAGAAGQLRAAPHEHRPGAALASAPLPRRQRGQHAPRRQRERERRQLTRRGEKLGPRRSARAAAGPAMGEGCVHLSGRGAAARGPEAAAWRRRRAKDAIAPCMRDINARCHLHS